jgi:hypothetical protein
MKRTPSTIDRQLVGQPAVRDRVDAMAIDYGTTTDEFIAAIAPLGIKVHPSSAARYRAKLRLRRHGPISPLAAAVIVKVLTLTRGEQQALANRLGVKVEG